MSYYKLNDYIMSASLAKKASEVQPCPYQSIMNFVQNMQEQLERIGPIIREHIQAA